MIKLMPESTGRHITRSLDKSARPQHVARSLGKPLGGAGLRCRGDGKTSWTSWTEGEGEREGERVAEREGEGGKEGEDGREGGRERARGKERGREAKPPGLAQGDGAAGRSDFPALFDHTVSTCSHIA